MVWITLRFSSFKLVAPPLQPGVVGNIWYGVYGSRTRILGRI
jgi:hypothetical protein